MSVNDYPEAVKEAMLRDLGIRIKDANDRKRGADGRFCYGACCTWFGSIHEVGKNSSCLPACPKCSGVLYELPDEGEWWAGIDTFERGAYKGYPHEAAPKPKPHPGYRAMWEWARAQPHCFRDIASLVSAYKTATGVSVDVER